MNQKKTGALIAKLRKEKNLTQAELAKRIGVTDKAVSKWEQGRGMPDTGLLKPLCDELGVTTDEFLLASVNTDNAEKQKKKKRDKGLVVAALIVVVCFSVWSYKEYKGRQEYLNKDYTHYFYGTITHYQSWDGLDKEHFVIYLNVNNGMSIRRIEVTSNTSISIDLRARLESGELGISIKVISIYKGKDYENGTKNGGEFYYPAFSIDLWPVTE